MPSRVWSRDDLRNILLALYAARFPQLAGAEPADDADSAEPLSFRWGYRVAIQSIMLACGLPLQLLDQAVQNPGPIPREHTASTHQWWIEDLENMIAAVYRSAVSAPNHAPRVVDLEGYRLGFSEVIRAVLQAIGSRKDPTQWLAEVHADRHWTIGADPGAAAEASRPRIIGSASAESEPLPPGEAE